MINKGKRLVYAHDVMDHYDDDFNNAPYEVASFYIDTPVDTIQALVSKFSPRLGSHGMNDRVHMSEDQRPMGSDS
jgi:hypothetical protein